MKGKQRASSVDKKAEKKWNTGDLDSQDEELFKHLPNPEEVTELLHPTEDLLKVESKRTKRRGEKG